MKTIKFKKFILTVFAILCIPAIVYSWGLMVIRGGSGVAALLPIDWKFLAPLATDSSTTGDYSLSTFANARSTTRTCLNPSDDFYDTIAATESCYEEDGLSIQPENINSCLQSREFSTAPWSSSVTLAKNQTGVFGDSNAAWLVTDDDASSIEYLRQNISITSGTKSYSAQFFVKPYPAIDPETGYPRFQIGCLTTGTTVSSILDFNPWTGDIFSLSPEYWDIKLLSNGFYRIRAKVTDNDSGNTNFRLFFQPAYKPVWGGATDASATGSVIIDQVDAVLDSKMVYSPIVTTTGAVTVNADTPKWTVDADFTSMFVSTYNTEEVPNNDWATGDKTNWTSNDVGISYNSPGITINTSDFSYISSAADLGIVNGNNYKFTYVVSAVTSGSLGLYTYTNGDWIFWGNITEAGTYNYRSICTGTTTVEISTNAFVGVVDSVSVKEVTSSSQGTIAADVTLDFDDGNLPSATTSGLVATADNAVGPMWLWTDSTPIYSGIHDGYNATYATFTPAISTTYKIANRWGVGVDYEMDASVDDVWANLINYAGIFNSGSYLNLGYGTILPFHIKNIRISDVAASKGQIDKLEIGGQ